MTGTVSRSPRRVLIASANPLFRDGLRKLYAARWGERAEVVGTTATMVETVRTLAELNPDLVIVDYDDRNINRIEFLNQFMSGHSSLKVVLVSLNEAGQVVIYDRKELTHAEADDWLADPWSQEDLISAYSEKEKKNTERRNSMRHFAIVGFLVLVVTLLADYAMAAIGLLPVEASAQAVPIDQLFRLQAVVISFLFALITVPLAYSLIVFRRKPGEQGDGEHFEGNTKLEILWTVIPLFVVLGFAYIGAESLGETRRVDPQAIVIKVTGFQWAWKFEYPEYGFTSTELYLPVDKQVVLKMESPDVIHSFWVPEFRIKQDVVPGRVTEYRITPTLIGDYKVRCAEICGVSHAYMESPVHVVSQEDYTRWLEEQQAAAAQAALNMTPEERGQKLVAENGCAGCHSIDGSKKVGPTWKGLFGEVVELADGSVVPGDEAYIIESIMNPNAKIVKGYAPGMPQFNFTDAQIADIVAYIKTLK